MMTGLVLVCVSSAGLMNIKKINTVIERVKALEQRPELELTCSIKDNQGRYVCRYVEIEDHL